MILETKDLIIRPSVWDDIEDFYEWERTPEVTEFFSIKDAQTKEDVIRKYIADDENPQSQQFTILLKPGNCCEDGVNANVNININSFAMDDNKLQETENSRRIGRIVIADIEEGWKAEIWRVYIADTRLRGKGLGKQAMEAIMGYCFDVLGLERLYLDHYTGNPAAYLYLSLGFKYEGILRKNCRKNGVLYDVHLMSMLREEYLDSYG